jgi:hypothetical protein
LALALASVLVFGALSPSLHASGEIISRAEFLSADLLVETWKKKGTKLSAKHPEPDPAAAALDRKRKVFGVGEKARLALVASDLDESSVEWSLEADDLPVSLSEAKAKKETTLKIEVAALNPQKAPFAFKVIATAKTTDGKKIRAESEYSVVTPSALTSVNYKEPPKKFFQMYDYKMGRLPLDKVGCGARLWLIPSPRTVNFGGGVFNKELDAKSPEYPVSGIENPKYWEQCTHPNMPAVARINSKYAGHFDDIAYVDQNLDYTSLSIAYSCYWKCLWEWGKAKEEDPPKTFAKLGEYEGEPDPQKPEKGNEKGIYWQKLSISTENGTCTISKFDSSVTRIAKREENRASAQEYK